MAERTETDVPDTLARDREHLAEWRSTAAGEDDYQETVERMRELSDRLRREG